MKYLNEYNNIIARYRAGEFGGASLSLYDILDRANNSGLMDKMDLSEIQCLLDSASGMTKWMFSFIKQKEKDKIIAMEHLERELAQYDIESYKQGIDISDTTLAHKLKLEVKYCNDGDLPPDTEAMLCPVDDKEHFGIIKILRDCATSKFSFRHELIHYFRDVKVGNRVTSEFARRRKGKTPNDEEQEVNYLTAASIMPVNEMRLRLDEFENATTQEEESAFLSELSKQYEQDNAVMLRRLIEVRRLVDYTNSANR